MARERTTLQNAEIAEKLEEIGELLAIEGENPFKVRAYQRAARELRAMGEQVAALVEEGKDLTELPGIGAGIAKKIEEIVRSGKLRYLEELEHEVGEGLPELLRVPGLGPKRVQRLHAELGVESLDDLRRALEAGKLRELAGFGAKSEAKLAAALGRHERKKERRLWAEVEPIARAFEQHLRGLRGVERVVVAGSFRRRSETVGDLDLLVQARASADVPEHFVAHRDVAEILARGPTRASVRLKGGLQIDLRVVPRESFGAALHYFTGSKAHNVAVRRLGQARGLKVNEYGVFRGGERIAGESEESVYAAVGLAYVEPELREDRGELEAAARGRLPKLLCLSDLRGDLHLHTTASDGRDSLASMVKGALALGHQYLCVSDHAGGPAIAHALDERALRRHLARVRELGRRTKGLRLLAGAEVEILADGRLGLSDELLAELDLAVCAVHSHFDLARAKQNARLERALAHPRCDLLGHPSGRAIGTRAPLELDLPRVLAAAKAHGVALELDSQPERLDLDDRAARAAKEAGVLVAISSDAHSAEQLGLLELGVAQARRAWLERADVLNTRTLAQLERWIAARRKRASQG